MGWRGLALSGALLAGCGPTLAEGVFACAVDDECPSDWFCRADGRCYRAPADGGVATDARPIEEDGSVEDGGGVDATPDGATGETDCGDGVDNDGDGATDCADSDCAGLRCQPRVEEPSASCGSAFTSVCARTGVRSISVSASVCVGGACEEQDGQLRVPCDRDTEGEDCDDGFACNGEDRCDDRGFCTVHEGGPCDDGQVCAEVTDACDRCAVTAAECSCSGVCGDANQDGMVGGADLSLVASWIMSGDETACGLDSADVDRDGAITERDARAITALFLGNATGGCASPCTGRCGDSNQDGAVSISDLSILQSGTPGVCTFLDGDVVQDGTLGLEDQLAAFVEVASTRPAAGACEPCEFECGDLNGDGSLDSLDTVLLRNLLMDPPAEIDVCTVAAADVVRDGSITGRDLDALRAMVLGTVAERRCVECRRACGDVDGNGVVEAADRGALEAILAGTDPTPLCQLLASDVDGGGGLDTGDVERLTAHFEDGTALECAE